MGGPSQRATERRAALRGPSARPKPLTRKALTRKPPTRKPLTKKVSATASATATRTSRASAALSSVRERPSLTGRAVVLAGVVALLVFTLALPVREVLHQRAEINALRAVNVAAQGRVDSLILRQERLLDPAYVTSLVRERLHYVLPGEVGYVVLDPSEAPAPTTVKPVVAGPAWYSALWSAVSTADGAGAPARTGVPVRPNAPK